MINRRTLLQTGAGLLAASPLYARSAVRTEPDAVLNMGIDFISEKLRKLIDINSLPEVVAEGFWWAEGPTWDHERSQLYFTDVPQNHAFSWSKARGLSTFLNPSTIASDTEGFREPGANGLWYAKNGDLLICDHGSRSIQKMNLVTKKRHIIADKFAGEPFNSPNDVVEAGDGAIYFTDPPYGLEGLDQSPLKRQPQNGVYRKRPGSDVELLVADMTLPNGVALSPDERTLYVAQSDPDAPVIRSFGLDDTGAITSDATFAEFATEAANGAKGLPDGMAITEDGHIFATAPGGVVVLTADGQQLGWIRTGSATANCAFGEDGRTLFITAQDRLLRLVTKAKGLQWKR